MNMSNLKRPIKAVVFDWDGVVMHEESYFSDKICKDYGLEGEEVIPFFRNELVQCQLGKMDLKDALKKQIEKWSISVDVETLIEDWFEFGVIDHEAIKFIKELKESGIKTALATNNEKYRIGYYKEKYDLESLFDYLIFPFEVGTLKPEPQLYQKVAEVLKMNPADVLFVDNEEKSLRPAEKLGFQVHLFKDLDGLKDILNLSQSKNK